MMSDTADLVFWAKQWALARKYNRCCRPQKMQTLYNINQAMYLTEVFSFLFERRRQKGTAPNESR